MSEKPQNKNHKPRKRWKKFLLIVLGALVVILGVVIYFYLSSTIYANSVPTVAANADGSNGVIDAMPEEVEIISEEEYKQAAQREAEAPEPTIVPEIEDEPIFERVEITDRVYNVLLVGDDARVGEPRARSDTMLLLSYNRDTRTLHITSLMRDMFVPTTLSGDKWNRINTIYAAGGPGRAVNVVNNLFSLDVQRYAVVRFASVFALVDQLDGLDLELTKDEAGVINKIFPEYEKAGEGVNHLNGRQVLAYSRMRHVGDGDFMRTVRQRYVLRVVLDKVLSSKSLKDTIALIQYMFENIETNIPLNEIITMGTEMFSGDKPAVEELRLPVDKSYNFARYYEASVLTIDFEKNIKALHEFLYGSSKGVKIPKFERPEMSAPEEPLPEEWDGLAQGGDAPVVTQAPAEPTPEPAPENPGIDFKPIIP